MTEENIVEEVVEELEYDDGSTSVYVKRRFPFNLLCGKITKKKVLCAFAIIVAVSLIFDFLAATVFCSSMLSKGGSKSFYNYLYGEDGLKIKKEDSYWLSEKSESVFLETENGERLHALKIKNTKPTNAYIVICHQYGESSLSMGEYARHFYELGFNLLLPDLRGHGKTEVKNTSMGWDDRLDIIAWCNEIIKEDEGARIILFGVSLGGTAVAMTAGEELPQNIRAVIADSCYSSVWDLAGCYLDSVPFVPTFPVRNMASAMCKSKMGWDFKTADTTLQAVKTDVPVLYIHGENDESVPIIQSNDIFEVCYAKGADQFIVQNGTHARNLHTDSEKYWGEIDLFILNYIGL